MKNSKTTSRVRSNKKLAKHTRKLEPSRQLVEQRSYLLEELAQSKDQCEAQNEELKNAQVLLEESRNRYVKLHEFAPIGYVTIDHKGLIREINRMGAKLLGLEGMQVDHLPFNSFIAKGDLPIFNRHIRHCRGTGEQAVIELHLENKSSHTIFYAQLITAFAEDPKFDMPVFWNAISDITERERARYEREFLMEELKEGHDRLTWLFQELLRIQEEERPTLARQLHDEVSQNLTALSVSLELIETLLRGDNFDRLYNQLKDTQMLVAETVARIRNMMANLRPTAIDFYGLAAVLEPFVKSFSERTGLQVNLQISPQVPRLAPNVEIALFRIAQEALTNIVKHAHVSEAQVSLEPTAHMVRLGISDKGKGFDTLNSSRTAKHSGLGLITMAERVMAVGGKFQVVSHPGDGTSIIVEVPR